MNGWLFAFVISGVALVAWWLGRRSGDKKVEALKVRLHAADNDLAAARLQGRAAEQEATELRRTWPKEISKPKRKRDRYGRFARR